MPWKHWALIPQGGNLFVKAPFTSFQPSSHPSSPTDLFNLLSPYWYFCSHLSSYLILVLVSRTTANSIKKLGNVKLFLHTSEIAEEITKTGITQLFKLFFLSFSIYLLSNYHTCTTMHWAPQILKSQFLHFTACFEMTKKKGNFNLFLVLVLVIGMREKSTAW